MNRNSKYKLATLAVCIFVSACGNSDNPIKDSSLQGPDKAPSPQQPIQLDPTDYLVPSYYARSIFLETPVNVDKSPHATDQIPAYPWQTKANEMINGYKLETQDIWSDLESPWSITTLPDGKVLVSEMSGKIHIFTKSYRKAGTIDISPLIPSFAYTPNSRQGLMDVTVSPDFKDDNTIYFTYPAKKLSIGDLNAVAAIGKVALDLRNLEATNFKPLFIAKGNFQSSDHYGARIVIQGNYLFATIGDHASYEQAQETLSHAGTVIRLHLDGSIPHDNPFIGFKTHLPEIWSLGHRNPQGLTYHPETQKIWSAEHGPAGGDEINLISPSENYGWPIISYGRGYSNNEMTQFTGLSQPIYYWDPGIAPSNLIFYSGKAFTEWKNDILLGALAQQSIVRLRVENERVIGEERLFTGEGRVRDIKEARDGSILWITDDGRFRRLFPREP